MLGLTETELLANAVLSEFPTISPGCQIAQPIQTFSSCYFYVK